MKWKKVLAFLKQRWFWQLLGVLVLSAAIWVVGDELRIGDFQPLAALWVRLLVILVLVGLWAGPLLWSQRQTAEKAREIAKGFDNAVEQGFSKAIKALKERHTGKRDFSQRYLYEIPWYLIIGSAGCGKTTLISNSDLDFILEGEFGQRGVTGKGGTRECDWFFTKQAILLDTPGRYTTQDRQQETDHGAWQELLDRLRRHRPRQPINGLLVAVSLQDLMNRSAKPIEIRQRINELYERLKVRFPIYLLITKCDLVSGSGFRAFFERLNEKEGAQVWGATLTLAEVAEPDSELGARTLEEFNLLLQRLTDRMLQQLNDEISRDRRVSIFRFPGQVAHVREIIADFVRQVFNPNDFEVQALLRGFYLTSATQFGKPSDYQANEQAKILGLDPSRLADHTKDTGDTGGTGRSYFINDLFREIVFPEALLVGSDPKRERRRHRRRMASYAAILAVGILLVLGWTLSYTRNQTAIEDVRRDAADAAQLLAPRPLGSSNFTTLAPPLDQLAAAAARFPESAPWSMSLGLYQGNRVRPRAEDAYQRVLETQLLASLGTRLSERLRSPAPAEETADVLKAYLMLGTPKQLDAPHVQGVMEADWAQQYPTDEPLRKGLAGHLAHLLNKRFAPLPLDANLVQSVRNRLAKPPRWETIYARIKAHAQANRADELIDLIGPNGDLVFTSTLGGLQTPVVPWLFTLEGLQNGFRPASRDLIEQAATDAWVYGIPADQQDQHIHRLAEELHQRYALDYRDTWRKALDSLHIRPTTNIRSLTEVVAAAGAADSPLYAVITRVAAQTQPAAALANSLGAGKTADTAAAAGSVVEVAAGLNTKVQTARQAVMKLERAAKQAGIATDRMEATTSTALRGVDDDFAKLRGLTVPRRNDPSDLDTVLKGLRELYEFLNSLERNGTPDQKDYDRLVEQLRGYDSPYQNLLRRTKDIANPLRDWVAAIGEDSGKAVRNATQHDLNALWGEVLNFCNKAFVGRYPFDRRAPREVTLLDFKRFFGRGKLFDTFYQNAHLTELIDTTTTPWRWRLVDGKGPGGTPQGLEQLERARRIQQTFFPDGDEPELRLIITPKDLDGGSLKFFLNIDGQQIAYSHEQPRPTNFAWPGPDGAGVARLEFFDRDGRTTTLSGTPGDWAWFRLLDRAERTSRGDLVNAMFKKDGHSMTIEIRAGSAAFNPLQQGSDLEQFRCPPRL